MKFESQLSLKKSRSTASFFFISLISAFLFTVPITILIFGLDPTDAILNWGYRSQKTSASTSPIIYLFGFLIIFALTFSILSFIKTGSQFAYKRILNNENRKNIVNKIFLYPGIHYNELLRTTELKSGQLQWHLNKLIQNKIVRTDKIEHFVVYFPMNMKVPVNIDYFFLKKSKITFTILKHIQKNPGIYQSKIGHDLNLKRNTVKYHIDKLLQKNFISSAQIGRKKHLYSSIAKKV